MLDDDPNQPAYDATAAAALSLHYSRKQGARAAAICRAAHSVVENRGSADLRSALTRLASAVAEVPGITEPVDPREVELAEEAVLVAWEAQLS